VGVILHSINEKAHTKFYIIDESSAKLKAITESNVDLSTYKSYKDALEFYLSRSGDNVYGAVGNIQIGTPVEENFLMGLYDYYKEKKLSLTKPKFALTDNIDGLFSKIFQSYVGKKYMFTEHKHMTVKRIMKNVFEERQLLDKKVAHDFVITPIKNLENVRINIDFGYKNGVWNYLQAIPSITGATKYTEWFAKTRFMFDNLENTTKVHFMFKKSDLIENKEVLNMINYFSNLNSNVYKLDLDDRNRIELLCSTIERDAHDDVEALLLA